ncbi:MAG: efflux RND transporter periplasmic adaptor subunit [Candidatus Omnitrophica bacterium]|nr:efflux RND transporter periplasmic adaptor subunit [Candidatus Omnitrophota bacterium]
MNRNILFTVLALTVFALPGCGKKETQDIHREKNYPVSVMEVHKADLAEFLFYSGDIEARDEATIFSKVSGKLTEISVQEGDIVKKNQILALVDRDEVGYEFALAPIDTPIDGILGRFYLDKGANLTLTTPVALVVNMDSVLVKIDVTEEDLPKVIKGLPAEIKVDAYPNRSFAGVVEKVSPVLDLSTRTAPAWISIENTEHELKPGMFARIKLKIDEHKDVLVVLRESVIGENSQRYVFVVNDGHVHKRKIELGLVSNSKFQVLSGLQAGEKVIVMGPADLKDGDIVRIVEEVGAK